MKTKDIANLNLYQAGNQSPVAIKNEFIVRTLEFQRVLDSILHDAKSPDESVQHYLLLGRRGSGKSTLLKRIEVEVQNHDELLKKFIPINLAEEQAGITRLYDIFEIVLGELIERGLPAAMPADEVFLGDASEAARLLFEEIHRGLSKANQRIVLLIDNIDKVFMNISGEAALLREILLNYSDMKIIGASTRMSEHFWKYDQPFYQFFLTIKLEALPEKDIHRLLLHWSTQYKDPKIRDFALRNPAKIKVLRQLTDGLPRTLKYFVQVLVQDMGLNTYEYLRGILDKISPLYQERLNQLSPELRKIVYNLAFIWEASEAGPLARRCRMKSNEASAKLKQLVDINIVETVQTGGRNHLYRLTERFFNLWIVMTQGSPADRRSAKFLTQFLEAWYSADEIKLLAQEHLESLGDSDGDPVQKLFFSKALVHSRYINLEIYDSLIEKSEAVTILEGWLDFPEKFSAILSKIQRYIEEKSFENALQVAESIPFHESTRDFVLGYISLNKGDSADAEKYYLEAIKKGLVIALNNLANLYKETDRPADAEKYYLEAIDKGHLDALYNLANLYKETDRPADAEKYYLEAIDKGHVGALNNLAILCRETDRPAEAEKYYLEAIEKGNVNALYNLANLYRETDRPAEAEKYYLEAIEKGNVNALYNLANLYRGTDRPADAEKYYLEAIDKGHVGALNNLANLYRETDRPADAEKYYLEAIDKGQVDALYNLANLYRETDRPAEAEKYYLEAIEKGQVDALNNLANLYRNTDRPAEAEKYYLEAIEKGQGDALASLFIFNYERNKNKKESQKFAWPYLRQKQDEKAWMLSLILKLWTGKLAGIQEHLEELLLDAGFGLHAIQELLIHHQYNLALKAFNDFEKSGDIKQKLFPVYFVLLELINDPKLTKERLKIPPEMVEAKDEILAYIKKRQAFYYPKNSER